MAGRFLSRLARGPLICAEGYLFELERRGWVQIGPFVPDVVLKDDTAVKQLHREFVRAGSDVIQAFTYYAHRDKMRLVGKENMVEQLNTHAIQIAKDVRDEFDHKDDLLIAGNICNRFCASLFLLSSLFLESRSWKKCERNAKLEQLWFCRIAARSCPATIRRTRAFSACSKSRRSSPRRRTSTT